MIITFKVCKNMTYCHHSCYISTHDKNMGNGKMVASRLNESDYWEQIPPQSIAKVFWGPICRK